jgi:L-glyceraldehyde 3-phosphate reductase
MSHKPSTTRYDSMQYRPAGRSGLRLPAISLGLWHNFGSVDSSTTGRDLVLKAFDLGISHFDLANNYGPPPGSAEENFGKIIHENLKSYRDEIVVATKAGYRMWPGPYGDWGSRKYLLTSLDQSLQRMGLDYVDIFYHHRPDPQTPLEETMGALDRIVRAGKALYVGVSSYSAEETVQASQILRDLGTPCIVHQVKYNMLHRNPEPQLLDVLGNEGIGCVPFCPLDQGILSNKYLRGIPNNSRAAKVHGFLRTDDVTAEKLNRVRALNVIANQRRQQLPQMALAWLLNDERVSSVLVGASLPQHLEENVQSLNNMSFTEKELAGIDAILGKR